MKPGGEDVDHRAADDLVHLEVNGQYRVPGGQDDAAQERGDKAQPDAPRRVRHDHRGEGGGEHHAFDGDVDHTRALAEDTAERPKQDGRGQLQRGSQDADEAEGRAASCPDQEGRHQAAR